VRGRNGWDAPHELADDIAAEAVNIVLERGGLGTKRSGMTAQTLSGTFTGVRALCRFVPSQDDTAAELLFATFDSPIKILRVAGGTTAAALTLANAVDGTDLSFAQINNKAYIAYNSDENRLHVFDWANSTTTVRRSGVAAPAAASVANTGSGSYAATLRYYRITWKVVISGVLQRQSNLGAAVSFTPSGSGTAARVTQPSVPSEGETHWVVHGSEDGDTYYVLSADITIGTTTYDDSIAPSAYSDNDASPLIGAATPWPSVKYLLSTGDRLLGYGAYESTAGEGMTPKRGRVWFSPILDSSDQDDDERISNTTSFKGHIDVARNTANDDRAIAGPLDDAIFTFQNRGVQMLIPTGQANQPYRRVYLSDTLGAVSHWSTFIGEDELGRPCLYFLDPVRGPYRYGANGFEELGGDVRDVWETFSEQAGMVVHGLWYPHQRAAVWWLTVSGASTPNACLLFFAREGRPAADGVRGGWVRWTGSIAALRCSALFAQTFGATMTRALKPYGGTASALYRVGEAASVDDAGTDYQGYVTSKAWHLSPVPQHKALTTAYLQAKAATDTVIRQTFTPNYRADQARTADVLLTADGNATRVLRKAADAMLADCYTLQVTIGDPAANENTWTLDHWIGTFEAHEER
jgi:hypothetical protein